ncbi:hypothetical protein C8F04DRAFT_1198020 [Mycena alexandri]|uniref:Uncharacterized protein n=1 Tax=Mycena alexandri TaxID=1745969 RepID=A0AAD6S1J7_9AGAR|nr:hypothetical protein C8F04DRAFT_1198020 [Mycena alexandri]
MGGVYGYETRVRQQSGMAGCAARAWVPRTVWAGTSRRAAVPTPGFVNSARGHSTQTARAHSSGIREPAAALARIPRVRRAGELGPRTPPHHNSRRRVRGWSAHVHARHPRRVRVGATRIGWGGVCGGDESEGG